MNTKRSRDGELLYNNHGDRIFVDELDLYYSRHDSSQDEQEPTIFQDEEEPHKKCCKFNNSLWIETLYQQTMESPIISKKKRQPHMPESNQD